MKNKIGEVLELFSPAFDQEKTILFNALVNRIGQAYPHYRSQIIQNELNRIFADDNNIEDQKYKSALNKRKTKQGRIYVPPCFVKILDILEFSKRKPCLFIQSLYQWFYP